MRHQACWNGKEAGRGHDKPPSLSVVLEISISHGDICFCESFLVFVHKKMGKTKSTGRAKDDLEIVPDAWERFERAVDVVAKSPPQHRKSDKSKPRKISAKSHVFPSRQ